jgi:hypothetical protein
MRAGPAAWACNLSVRTPLTAGPDPSKPTLMERVVVAFLSIREAAEQTGTSKVDIWRAIRIGRLPAKTDDGGFAIDPTELFGVFELNGTINVLPGRTQRSRQRALRRPETGATLGAQARGASI